MLNDDFHFGLSCRRSTDSSPSSQAKLSKAIQALLDSNLLQAEVDRCNSCYLTQDALQFLECVQSQCSSLLGQLLPSKAEENSLSKRFRNLLSSRNSPASSTESAASPLRPSEEGNDLFLQPSRTKRWQYADHLQMCMQAHCLGKQGAEFYACVYDQCMTNRKNWTLKHVELSPNKLV